MTSLRSASATPQRLPRYVGRFAPSPTGPLHLGSVVAALGSWLDARAAMEQGIPSQWRVRIEDLDVQRCSPEAAHLILQQLDALGLQADGPVVWQSNRTSVYETALDTLRQQGKAYACSCSRKDIEAAWTAQGKVRSRFETLIYPGTCRYANVAPENVRAWRFLAIISGTTIPQPPIQWRDRRLGAFCQDVALRVGDFALLRGDGIWSYQIGCVVDDAAQGITHVVRGEDLADNTPRQIALQQAFGYAPLSYLHLPLARDASGEKLSKSNQAPSIDTSNPLAVLRQAASVLTLPLEPAQTQRQPHEALAYWAKLWSQWYPLSQ